MKTKAFITARGKTRSIFIRLSYGAYEVNPDGLKKYRRIEYYTGETIRPNEWINIKGKSRNNSFLNGQIERACIRMEKIYAEMAYDGKLDHEALKEAIKSDGELNDIFHKGRIVEVKENYIAPMDFIQRYIDKANVSEGTRKDYLNTLMHLKAFDEYRGRTATWKTLGYEYYLELVNYLKEKQLKGSTIDKIIKNLKLFLQQADLQDNISVNQDFKRIISGKSLFAKVNREETDHVYLDETEIKMITDAKMPDERLAEIRDLFVIQCWTGLRISDLSRLERGNIANGLLSIKTKKTKESVVVPVTEELQKVLNKYPEQLPKTMTDQHYNRQLKIICKFAGIDEPIMAEVKTNGMTVIKQVPKYELVTSHTARRSFATNLYRRGLPASQIMLLTGHKTEGAFLRYIKVSKEDNARDVLRKLKIS
ncbi:MAG: site-specific tyrosine recombinase XerC [Bacteroidetes bacterium ADurb.BinA261]|nr:MAG: site-specific tyrosine recombinase XerC [Bacteroidetes bacterium ADurb.BinA261]